MTVTDPPEMFRSKEVCEQTGATYRQLDYWERTNIARPSGVNARGSGSQRLYTSADLPIVRLLVRASASMPRERTLKKLVEGLTPTRLDEAINANPDGFVGRDAIDVGLGPLPLGPALVRADALANYLLTLRLGCLVVPLIAPGRACAQHLVRTRLVAAEADEAVQALDGLGHDERCLMAIFEVRAMSVPPVLTGALT